MPSAKQMEKARQEQVNNLVPNNLQEEVSINMPKSDNPEYLSEILVWLHKSLSNICRRQNYNEAMTITEMSSYLKEKGSITENIYSYIIRAI